MAMKQETASEARGAFAFGLGRGATGSGNASSSSTAHSESEAANPSASSQSETESRLYRSRPVPTLLKNIIHRLLSLSSDFSRIELSSAPASVAANAAGEVTS